MRNPPLHVISSPDEASGWGICAHCGPVEIRKKPTHSGFRWECRVKNREENRRNKRNRRAQGEPNPNQRQRRRAELVQDRCERCGFEAEDPCQLQVDHKVPRWEGGSNQRDNLQVLCANCHALKTKRDIERYNAPSPA